MISKRTIKTKIVSLILSLVLIVGFAPFVPASDVNAAGSLTINASYLNRVMNGSEACPSYLIIQSEGSGKNVEFSDLQARDIYLVMDQALSINKLTNNFSKVYISGSNKLTINNTFLQQNDLTIESGATVVLNGINSKISQLVGYLDVKGNIICQDYAFFISTNEFYLSGGSIKGTISQSIKCKNAHIESGTIDLTTGGNGIDSTGNIDINGGNIKIKSEKANGLYANSTLSFNGGYLEASTSTTLYYDAAVVAGKSISIGDSCYIKSPANGKTGMFSDPYVGVLDASGNKANSAILKEVIKLEKATVTGVKNKPYTGSPITQNPVVTYNGTTLKEGTHYNTSYENNTAKGTAKMILTGIEANDVIGTVTIEFTIKDSSEPEDDVAPYNPSGGNGGNNGGSSGGNNGGNGSGGNGSGGNRYSNEWVNGKWYNANGVCDYDGVLQWKSDATGWWVEDSAGWYPVSQWQKIDGKYYYFTSSGYMDYSEYRDGCWLGSDGAWVEAYSGGHWASDSTGWWFEDASGWYPQSQWVWIDGYCYYFEASGYMATNKYVDGCWVGSDGSWQ